MYGYWERYLAQHHFAPDGDEGGGGGGEAGKPKPAWAAEFGETFDPEKAWSLITKLRGAETDLSKQNKDLSKKVGDFEALTKTEVEKAQGERDKATKELETLRASHRATLIATAVQAEGVKEGAHYPDDIYRLIDESDIQVDDDGKVKNAAALVKALKKDRPALFKPTADGDGGRGRNGAPPAGTDMNALIRRAAGREVNTT